MGADTPHSSLSPLFSALTGYIFEEAKRLASHRPLGRLDPPLMLCLDEAALIAKVPLDRWTADAGGRGIPLLIAVQSKSQLVQGWGEAGCKTIWNNSNVKLVLGGLTDTQDLNDLALLCGERSQRSTSKTVSSEGGRSRNRGNERVQVFTPSFIRTLPAWRALVLFRNARPVLIRMTPAWERRDVKTAKR